MHHFYGFRTVDHVVIGDDVSVLRKDHPRARTYLLARSSTKKVIKHAVASVVRSAEVFDKHDRARTELRCRGKGFGYPRHWHCRGVGGKLGGSELEIWIYSLQI